MEKEEGEMSDDNAMLVDDLEEPNTANTNKGIETNLTVLYKAEKNGIVVEQLERIDAAKLEERAKRFGLNLCGNRLVTQTQIDELYANSGVESGNERHFRFDALHLNGVDSLTAKDIFEYLEDYKPVSLEKVDDVSCNVVCQDHISVALALLVHSREIKNEELKKMLADKSNHHWREGMPHPKKDLILMRFATNGDKKVSKKNSDSKQKQSDEYYDQSMDSVSKNPWGDLCRSWGVYDHQETFQRHLPKNDYEEDVEEEPANVQIKNKRLASRLGKRSHRTEESEESSSDSEWKKKSKTPRLRMHADDEESKHRPKKQVVEVSRDVDDAYAPLCIEVVNSQSTYTPRETTKLSDKFKKIFRGDPNLRRDRVHSRLGVKVMPTEQVYSDDYSSDNSEHNIMSRVQKVTSTTKNVSVWSRLATQSSKNSSRSDLRQVLKSKQKNPIDIKKNLVDKPKNLVDKHDSVDLRGRISTSKKTNLRIEIDNNYAN